MYFPSEMLMAPRNPSRPVDARWQRVTDLADRGEPANHEWDDDWVRRGLDYLNRLRACRDDADRDRLAQDLPDLHAAYGLHGAADKLNRGVAEARILARQSIEEVAADRGLTPAAVSAYEALFFSVAGRLDVECDILCLAIGTKLWYGATEEDVDVILKWVGYLKGPILLDVMIRHYTSNWELPARLDGLSRAQLEELYLMLCARALVLIRVATSQDILRMLRFVELVEEFDQFIESLPTEPAGGRVTLSEGPQAAPSGPTLSPAGGAAFTSERASAPGIDLEAWWSAWRAAVLAA